MGSKDKQSRECCQASGRDVRFVHRHESLDHRADERATAAHTWSQKTSAVRPVAILPSIHGSRQERLPPGLSSGDRFPAGSRGLAAQRARAR